MKIFDPGHNYAPDIYDGKYLSTFVQFMKREGANYPGNVGSYPGTNNQEVLRILINRTQYLDNQIHSWVNTACIGLYRLAINLLEYRAAKRHQRKFRFRWKIEKLVPNANDGHLRY